MEPLSLLWYALCLLQRLPIRDKAVEFLVGPKGQALRKAISVVGGMVIGAVAATWVSVTTALQFKNSEGKVFLNIQEKIDGVYPGLLTAAFITLC